MEEQKYNSSSEIDLSDGWTVVNNDDSEGNVNAEVGETSDSESLEVLEVEQGDPEQNDTPGHEENCSENSCDEECTVKDCDDCFISEDPLNHLAAVRKVRKYVHNPSAYINMWLSIVMVIAIAITLGLGIGHYLGSKRFARAKDMIHHLKYENQMLEQELADVTMKNKHYKNDLRSRVRKLMEGLNQPWLPDSSCCRNYYLQANIYGSLMYGHDDDDVCYAEENPLTTTFFKDHYVNESMPPFLQWFTYVNIDGEENLLYSFEDNLASNGSYFGMNRKGDVLYSFEDNLASNGSYFGMNRKGDASFDVNSSFLNVGNVSDKMLSTQSPFFLPNLNTRLTFLHSLLKKWREFHENVKIQTTTYKAKTQVRLQIITHRPEVTSKVTPLVSGNSNKISSENVKHTSPISSNGFCRSKVNQCISREEKPKCKERKCKALPKSQLFCSLLVRFKNKSGNMFLDKKQKVHGNKIKRSGAPKFTFEEDKNKMFNKQKLTHERRKETSNVKFRTREEGNNDQRQFKDDHKVSNIERKYSLSDTKKIKMKKKSKLEKSSKFMGSKGSSQYKHTYFAKNQKIKENEKKNDQTRRQFEKQSFSHTHQQKQKHFKLMKKPPKQFKNHDIKDALNNKNKRHIIWGKQKYFDKFESKEKTNRNKSKDFKKQPKEKRFPTNTKKMNEGRRHSTQFKQGSSENSNICKTKNGSECVYLKYPLNVPQKDKNFQKYWKERSKMYQINMQEIKILES